MKSLLWIASILFFILSWWWYVCPHKKVCPFGQYAAVAVTEANRLPQPSGEHIGGVDISTLDLATRHSFERGRILFNWSEDKPYTSDAFSLFRDSLLSALGDSDLLEIVGNYYADERNNTPFPNLGYARANKMKMLFSGLASDRFNLKSSLLQKNLENARSKPFLASAFRRIIRNGTLREVAGKMIINFPHASDEMLENMEIDAYLNDLMARLKNTEEQILIIGHTDNTASSKRNLSLGWKRADAIRNLLLRKGLSSKRIITDSKGEEEPIASNDTQEGRAQNRRVELTIISGNQ